MVRRAYVTTRTHEVFASAHDLADALGHDLSAVHLVIALLRERKNVAAQLLRSRVAGDVLERDLEAHLPPAGLSRTPVAERAWSSVDEKIVAQAGTVSRELGMEYVGCEHVLLALLLDDSDVPARILTRHGIRFSQLRDELVASAPRH